MGIAKEIDSPFMEVDEAARFLKMSENSLYIKARQGKIPCRRHGRLVRFVREELLNWTEPVENQTPLNVSKPVQFNIRRCVRTKKRDIRSLIIEHTSRLEPKPEK